MVSRFTVLWAVFVIAIGAYAFFDRAVTPDLQTEMTISMQPNLAQLPDLLHWGGRLLTHGQIPLLVGNALVLGGFLALIVNAVVKRVQQRHKNSEPERVFSE